MLNVFMYVQRLIHLYDKPSRVINSYHENQRNNSCSTYWFEQSELFVAVFKRLIRSRNWTELSDVFEVSNVRGTSKVYCTTTPIVIV